MGHDDAIQPVSAGMDEKRAMEPGSDEEKLVMTQSPTLKRKLKSRHLQMIAIGMLPFTQLFPCS
jgi:amino acid permease